MAKSHRVGKGGPKVTFKEMGNDQLQNTQRSLNEHLWYHDKYGYPFTGNIKSRERMIDEINSATDELNRRFVPIKQMRYDYVRLNSIRKQQGQLARINKFANRHKCQRQIQYVFNF